MPTFSMKHQRHGMKGRVLLQDSQVCFLEPYRTWIENSIGVGARSVPICNTKPQTGPLVIFLLVVGTVAEGIRQSPIAFPRFSGGRMEDLIATVSPQENICSHIILQFLHKATMQTATLSCYELPVSTSFLVCFSI